MPQLQNQILLMHTGVNLGGAFCRAVRIAAGFSSTAQRRMEPNMRENA